DTVYKGLHRYGKDDLIERPVPAILDEETWERAQAALRANQTFSVRNARRPYLLRGLIKCAHCGYAYSGCARQGRRALYVCLGERRARPRQGHPHAPAQPVTADDIEALIWNDTEGSLRTPEGVLPELAAQQGGHAEEAGRLQREVGKWTRELDL